MKRFFYLRSNITLTFVLALCLVLFNFLSNEILNVEELVYNSLAENFTVTEITNQLKAQRDWEFLGYILVPILVFVKVALLSFALYVGAFFFNKQIKFNRIYNIVLKADFFFLLIPLTKIIRFSIFSTSYHLEDLIYFFPLSALSIIGYENLAPWFIYPFQLLNLFELAYWFILAFLLGKELKSTMDEGFKIVASSYGPALLIWVVAVMFFTLNVS